MSEFTTETNLYRNRMMNDEDILQFMIAFDDFQKHAAVEMLYAEGRQAAAEYAQNFYEQKAAELEVTVDYYMQEFL